MTEQRLVDTYTDTETNVLAQRNYVRFILGYLRVTARPVSPVVEGTPVYSGDTAAVGELAEETPTEWTERAGE